MDDERLSFDPPFEPADEFAAMEEGVDVPPPAALVGRFVDLPEVFEAPEGDHLVGQGDVRTSASIVHQAALLGEMLEGMPGISIVIPLEQQA